MFLPTCLVSVLALTLAAADGPVHIELPVYDQPQAGSDGRLAQPLEPENTPGEDRSSKSLVGGLLMHKIMLASNAIGSKIASTSHAKESFDFGGPFAPPVTTLEGVLLESEGYGSKKLSIKENIHSLAAGFLQPKPIVDTIREDEKYGNHGDKFYYAGRAIVGGAEGVSNLVNSILEVPGNIFKKIARSATEKLNNLGGRLIGL